MRKSQLAGQITQLRPTTSRLKGVMRLCRSLAESETKININIIFIN